MIEQNVKGNSYKALILEDEELAERTISEAISLINTEIAPYKIEIVSTLLSYIEQNKKRLQRCSRDYVQGAIELIQETIPDIIFLDLDFGHRNEGFLVLASFQGNQQFKTVFVTNHVDTVLAGYSSDIFDIIDKLTIKFSLAQFKVSLVRLIAEIERERVHQSASELSELYVFTNGRKIKVDIARIAFIEASSNYCDLYLEDVNGKYKAHYISNNNEKNYKVVTIARTLLDMSEKLPQFIRCHRSFLVNPAHISSLSDNSQYIVLKNSNKKIPIARGSRKEVVQDLRNKNIISTNPLSKLLSLIHYD